MGYPPEAPAGAVSGRRPVGEVLTFEPAAADQSCVGRGPPTGRPRSRRRRPVRRAGARAPGGRLECLVALPVALGPLRAGQLALLAAGGPGVAGVGRGHAAARGRRRRPPARSAGRTPPRARYRPRRGSVVTPVRKNTVAAVPDQAQQRQRRPEHLRPRPHGVGQGDQPQPAAERGTAPRRSRASSSCRRSGRRRRAATPTAAPPEQDGRDLARPRAAAPAGAAARRRGSAPPGRRTRRSSAPRRRSRPHPGR